MFSKKYRGERFKTFSNTSLAVPRSIAGCGKAIGEVAHSDGGVKQYNNRTIFLTPLLRNYRSFGLSPIFCTAKHRGERAIPTAVTKLSPPSLPAMPRSITGSCKTACKEYGDETYCSVSWTKGESDLCHTLMSYFFKCIIYTIGRKGYFSILSPCVSEEI